VDDGVSKILLLLRTTSYKLQKRTDCCCHDRMVITIPSLAFVVHCIAPCLLEVPCLFDDALRSGL